MIEPSSVVESVERNLADGACTGISEFLPCDTESTMFEWLPGGIKTHELVERVVAKKCPRSCAGPGVNGGWVSFPR